MLKHNKRSADEHPSNQGINSNFGAGKRLQGDSGCGAEHVQLTEQFHTADL